MSTVRDEAADGPLKSSSGEEEKGKAPYGDDESKQAPGENRFAPGLAEPYGVETLDRPVTDNPTVGNYDSSPGGLDSEGFGAVNPGPGRPSSADGSLSTPDDTPSLQVSNLYGSELNISLIMVGLYSIIIPSPTSRACRLWAKSNAFPPAVRSKISSSRVSIPC